jgi:creatinine amidohydrolase
MTEKVHYLHLRPDEFLKRIAQRSVAYLPLGTLEWHGPHNPLGGDALLSTELFERAATRFGGIVFPPLFLGPDAIVERDEGMLNGMDYLYRRDGVPEQQLPGSCYWVPDGVFLILVEAVIVQAKRAGFKCVVADGHGPSRGAFNSHAVGWEGRFGIKLIGANHNVDGEWRSQRDHAARNETSLMMAAHPDLVDMSTISSDRDVWPVGVGGEDPRDSSAEYGEELYEDTLVLIGEALERVGV